MFAITCFVHFAS